MKKYIVIDKKVGETPLQALENFRQTDKKLADLPLTYAGRLDPMASGKLLILIGEECKRRDSYTKFDKEYEFEILLGFKSDTGDVLGLAESGEEKEFKFSEKPIYAMAEMVVGTHTLPYPAFSSKTIDGKPLFHYAIEGKLDEIEIPASKVRVCKMEYCGKRQISGSEMLKNIESRISLLKVDESDLRIGSDFRKSEILECWEKFQKFEERQFVLLKFRTVVSSGTYIRALVPIMAKRLGTCGLAYSIHRTKIGKFSPITKHFGFWRKTF